MTNQTRCLASAWLIQEPQNKPVNPQTLQRTERFALGWKRRNEDPSLPLLGPLRGRPCSVSFAFLREADEGCLQPIPGRREHRLAAGVRVGSIRCACSVPLSLRSISSGFDIHCDQLLGRRPVGHQEGKDLLRRLDEKLALLILRRLEQRGRKRLRFGAAAQLLGWSPIGATFVEWIEDDIAARLGHRIASQTRGRGRRRWPNHPGCGSAGGPET